VALHLVVIQRVIVGNDRRDRDRAELVHHSLDKRRRRRGRGAPDVGNHAQPPACGSRRSSGHVEQLDVVEQRAFAGRPARHERVDAGLGQELDVRRERACIDRAVGRERTEQGDDDLRPAGPRCAVRRVAHRLRDAALERSAVNRTNT
jgi:hypothetical protein